MPLPTDLTEREEVTLMAVLGILRGDWDRVEINHADDIRDAFVRGKQFPAGARVMGTTLTVRGFCDRVRDPLPGEII